jgi:hypothetical protein
MNTIEGNILIINDSLVPPVLFWSLLEPKTHNMHINSKNKYNTIILPPPDSLKI